MFIKLTEITGEIVFIQISKIIAFSCYGRNETKIWMDHGIRSTVKERPSEIKNFIDQAQGTTP